MVAIVCLLFRCLYTFCFTPKTCQIRGILSMLLNFSPICAFSLDSLPFCSCKTRQQHMLCCGTRAARRNKTQQHSFRDTVRVKQLSGLQAADKEVWWVWADNAASLSVSLWWKNFNFLFTSRWKSFRRTTGIIHSSKTSIILYIIFIIYYICD